MHTIFPRFISLFVACTVFFACTSGHRTVTLEASPPPDHKPETVPGPSLVEAVLSPQAGENTCKGPCTMTFPSGSTTSVPEGMQAKNTGSAVFLTDAENSVTVVLQEIEVASCREAIDSVWKTSGLKFIPKVDKFLTPPASDGFDEICVETYVKPDGGPLSQAVARRKGNLFWVHLLHGPGPAIDKRAAQIMTFLTSLKAAGVKEEDLGSRPFVSIRKNSAKLETFIEEAMKVSGLPGLSIAVVEDNAVVWSRGFGRRETGKPAPVTPGTLMMIGSITKPLTTFMMGTLVDDLRFKWDTPVRSLHPEFTLGDPELAKKLTMEQLVCACMGLPRKDLPLILSFWDKKATDCLRELGQMRPSTAPGETFQYQNHMVGAAGFVSARAMYPKLSLEQGYEKLMQERVFAPAGMKDTTLNHETARRFADRAAGHSLDMQGAMQPVSLEHERFVTYIAPSGGIWSTATDMARFLLVELNSGVVPDGRRVISLENMKRRWTPQVAINADASYGLGYVTARDRGLLEITHSGGTMGFSSLMAFFPDKGIGFVILTNGVGTHVAGAVRRRLIELWFSVDDKAAEKFTYGVEQFKKALAEETPRISEPTAEWMKPYLGTLHHPELGDARITAEKTGFFLTIGKYRTRLKLYTTRTEKTVLVFETPPLAGLELTPVADSPGTLELSRGQEKYLLTPKK